MAREDTTKVNPSDGFESKPSPDRLMGPNSASKYGPGSEGKTDEVGNDAPNPYGADYKK